MRVEGSGSSLCLGAHQSFGLRGLESSALWMARRAACSSDGGAARAGVLSSTGECGQPSRSTHIVPAAPRAPAPALA